MLDARKLAARGPGCSHPTTHSVLRPHLWFPCSPVPPARPPRLRGRDLGIDEITLKTKPQKCLLLLEVPSSGASQRVVPHGRDGAGTWLGAPEQAWKEARGVGCPSPRPAQPCRGPRLGVLFLGGESPACVRWSSLGPGGPTARSRRGVAVAPGLAPHACTSVPGNSVDRCWESRPTVERSLRGGERVFGGMLR